MNKIRNKCVFFIALFSALGMVINSDSFAAGNLSNTPVKTVKSNSSVNLSDNYLDEVYRKYKQIVIWKKNYLLVYIPKDTREQFVWSQFKIWENVLGGLIVFEKVPTERNADILVHYENPYLGKKVGFTRLSFKDGEIRQADMFIYDDILTNPLKDFAVLHEIGHALGITNHSSNPSDIMFATRTARQHGLSQRDKNTISIMYDPDKRNYVNPVSMETTPSNKSMELQKADMFKDNMQYQSAIEIYNEILDSGKEQYEAISGLAACYYAMGNGDKAYKYSKKALSVSNNDINAVYNYITVALNTNHERELDKFLDKYIKDNPNSVSDGSIQAALVILNGRKTAGK